MPNRSLTECLDAAQAAINGMPSPAHTYRSGTEAIEQAKATLAEIRRRLKTVRERAPVQSLPTGTRECTCLRCGVDRIAALIGEEKA